MKDFIKLTFGQNGYNYVFAIYTITKRFLDPEKFGIIYPCRRSVFSIITNCLEGSIKQSALDFGRFLKVALGSSTALQNLLIKSRNGLYL